MTSPDLRHGRFQDVLGDIECDAVISDPPYGGRTHEGQEVNREDGSAGLASDGLGYAHWTPADVREFVDFWAPRNRGWFAVQTSHDLCPAWEDAYRAAGLTVFAPVPCVMRGMSVRLTGDGPSSWAVWLMVARPKALSKWGTLRGAYEGPPNRDGYPGGKPLWLMEAIVRDYSKPGDLVVDPCFGGGTTIAAALANDRRAAGAEVNAEAFQRTQARLRSGVQRDLFGGQERAS